MLGGGALTTTGTLVAALVLGRRQGVSVSASWDAGPRLRIVREMHEIAEAESVGLAR